MPILKLQSVGTIQKSIVQQDEEKRLSHCVTSAVCSIWVMTGRFGFFVLAPLLPFFCTPQLMKSPIFIICASIAGILYFGFYSPSLFPPAPPSLVLLMGFQFWFIRLSLGSNYGFLFIKDTKSQIFLKLIHFFNLLHKLETICIKLTREPD